MTHETARVFFTDLLFMAALGAGAWVIIIAAAYFLSHLKNKHDKSKLELHGLREKEEQLVALIQETTEIKSKYESLAKLGDAIVEVERPEKKKKITLH